jgi:hypothetical protein
MRFELSPESHVAIDLRATGILKAVAHNPTLTARPQPIRVQLAEPLSSTLDLPVDASFRVDAIDPPQNLPPQDRERMRDNLRGDEVLGAARYPAIELHARYRGSLERGTLTGVLVVRGAARPITMELQAAREGDVLRVTGAWEGKLTDLGVKPYKALLGAIKLADWVRLRLEARFRTIAST